MELGLRRLSNSAEMSPEDEKVFCEAAKIEFCQLREDWGDEVEEEAEPGDYLRDVIRDSEQVYSLMRDDETVGVVALRTRADQLKIEYLVVKQDCRRQGIGRQALRAIEILATEKGHSAVGLESIKKAEGFYENAGYQKIPSGYCLTRFVKVLR